MIPQPGHPDPVVAGVFLFCGLSMYWKELKEKLRFWR
jgi:hypothetical protein